jgi:hypothetical protein
MVLMDCEPIEKPSYTQQNVEVLRLGIEFDKSLSVSSKGATTKSVKNFNRNAKIFI